MKSSPLIVVALACLLAMPAICAQQASAPAGSTGQCKDGSYTSTASKRGACRGHKGVQQWYAAAPVSKAAPATAAATVAAAPAPAPAVAAAPAANMAMKQHRTMPAPAANAAPGGGPGMVWVNDSSKVYHCAGDKWYGKTKHGEYMSEADAKAKGDHGPRGKSCAG
ncbi:DUF3761 domain-containing protein [Rhodanobacter ginsengiterrae]|uniref:DUF3761 domain-containing protein n=1 Tax=Rhodanobacter ginsengiterrae TaxID=2008451 RepID=UPI003CF68872